MFSVDLPVSLKVSLRLSPFSRLMPLNEASCDVVVICWMMLLYWLTKPARMVCEAASASGLPAAPPAGGKRVGVLGLLSAMGFPAGYLPGLKIALALVYVV